jgi:hypothetical protein
MRPRLISVPVAVHNSLFEWQLDLFWFNHKLVYGRHAAERVRAIVIKRNLRHEPKHERMEWDIGIPHLMCESFFDYLDVSGPTRDIDLPLNIQIGLSQALQHFDDDQVIEVLDCDMFHLRPYPEYPVRHDEIVVADIYERWHLKSLGHHRNVIDIYFENDGRFYNGGFVPIIARVRTFKKLMYEWTAVHRHILTRNLGSTLSWWAGMYALQAACEKVAVRMIAKDCCYIPGINALAPAHYVCHYAVDGKFDKRRFPRIDPAIFQRNIYYDRIRQWLAQRRRVG